MSPRSRSTRVMSSMHDTLDEIVLGHGHRGEHLEPRQIVLRDIAVGDGLDRHDHLAHGVERAVDDLFRVRDEVQGFGAAATAGHHRVELGLVDAARETLLAQDREGPIGSVGPRPRRLQEREEVLRPTVRRERLVHEGGQQQRLFAERADDLELLCHGG